MSVLKNPTVLRKIVPADGGDAYYIAVLLGDYNFASAPQVLPDEVIDLMSDDEENDDMLTSDDNNDENDDNKENSDVNDDKENDITANEVLQYIDSLDDDYLELLLPSDFNN